MRRAYDVAAVEKRWQVAWEEGGCFRAPDRPTLPKFFNYDSGPFPSGPLHLGHVRTYVLGDVMARYQRLLGKCVLYVTDFDAFGLPCELAATRCGEDPESFVRRHIAVMTRQLRALGVSYDWARIPTTCDPAYYRHTQALFLELLDHGLVERTETEAPFCPGCGTALATVQIAEGRCWRCAAIVETRRIPGWVVRITPYLERLRSGLDRLLWSRRARRLVRSLLDRALEGESRGAPRFRDWLVSRQRSWGTPIPIVHCRMCGPVPVSKEELPVRLPRDLDWKGGPIALSRHPDFVHASCPRCRAPSRRETDTLDCFFDGLWCSLAGFVPLDRFSFRKEVLDPWMPVDHFHSGLDTFVDLHLRRFLGLVLEERGCITDPELIASHHGHEMVLRNGRKMSKHLGNAVSPEELLEEHGADALRVAVLGSASPGRSLAFDPRKVGAAARELDSLHALVESCRAVLLGKERPTFAEGSAPSRAARALSRQKDRALRQAARFFEEYRPQAAIETLFRLARSIREFALPRLGDARLLPGDARILEGCLSDLVVGLAPAAPHLCEELRNYLGKKELVVRARWPGGSVERREERVLAHR